VGALVALEGIQNRKHIVMLNVETDVVIGPLLKRLADAANVVYTLTIGDEPGAISELHDFVVSLGMEVVCAGKSPFKPIIREETPETLSKEASRLGLNPRMLCSFRDGSKTDIEMAAVANGTGLVPDVPGMHGPQVTLADLPKAFSLKNRASSGAAWSICHLFSGSGGQTDGRSVAPSLRRSAPILRCERTSNAAMGPGPTGSIGPYHLVGIETPISIGRAAVYGDASLAWEGWWSRWPRWRRKI
jgi:predicted homoserine dehydrogenase-like protein